MNINQDPSSSDIGPPRIHTPASIRSPNFLDPDSPTGQDDDEEDQILTQREPTNQLLDPATGEQNSENSDTYTEPEQSNDGIQQNPPQINNENSNDSSSIIYHVRRRVTYETGDENSMDDERPISENNNPIVLNQDSNISNVVPMHNEDSNPISVATEDSNLSIPASQTRKKSECDEPPAKVRKVNSSQENEEIDGDTCPICLDAWGNSGDHRLVSLKCGHLFGAECVRRWLKAQPPKEGSCPTCKSKAVMKDLRFIYAKRLVAADTSQITALQKQLETVQAEKSRTVLELQKTKIAHRACLLQLEVLRTTLMKSQITREPVKKSWRFALEKNLEISKDGGCRVMTYNCRTYELYVSQKSTNNLFPGYGIRKVSCVDYKLGQFLHLHPKPIRDITYSPPRDLLLSVGLDSCARIVDRGSPSVTINAGFPLWCCSWDHLRSNEFYVGGVGGTVHTYDIRNLSGYIATLPSPGDMSPVISLCSTAFGLLSCQLNKCWLWVVNERRWGTQEFPLDGPFMSMSYDSDSQKVLMSTRPSGQERSKLTVCRLKQSLSSGDVLVDVEDTYSGSTISTIMTRAAWVKAPGASWVAAHSESDSTLYLNGLDGARTMSLPAVEPALDVCSAQLNGNSVLAALSESRLRIYKAVAMNC
ncbi:unnamed protein product [Arctia plantaginis]|uniref:RING-type E3 ubiquitin transferase n=1 Tax=Arctia plantaginis TaxID=874455 RepID=A0A8S1AHB6_ARCPL|nr:unnamed protein product [Arctia plantaginis]